VAKFIVADTHSTRGCYVNAMGIEAKKITKKDPTFNLLCHALQGVEALALKTVVTQHGEDILLCMHDGWVSRRRLDLKKLKRRIFRTQQKQMEALLSRWHPIGIHQKILLADGPEQT
jgi:hypothetical protein